MHFFHEEVFAMKNKFAMQMLLYITVELKKLKSKSKNKEVFIQILKVSFNRNKWSSYFPCVMFILVISSQDLRKSKKQFTITDRVLKFLSNIFQPWRKELER